MSEVIKWVSYPWEEDIPLDSVQSTVDSTQWTVHSDPTIKEFGEDIDTTETEKDKLKRYYNEFAISKWYENITEFYVKTKMRLLTSWELDSSDDKLIKLLNTIASDLWYGWQSKQFVMENGLNKTWKSLLWK